MSNPAKLLLAGPIARATVPSPVDWRHWLKLSVAKTLGVLSFTPLTMLQACAQAVDFKVGHHFGEGHPQSGSCWFSVFGRRVGLPITASCWPVV